VTTLLGDTPGPLGVNDLASQDLPFYAALVIPNSNAYDDAILAAMNDYAVRYEIDSPFRIAHFLAQIGHESGFRMTEEVGNYSAKRMRQIFGCKGGLEKYITSTDECLLGRFREDLDWLPEETLVD
jgi:hypothetical protein